MRLIDADALIEAHYDYCCKHHGEADNFYVWSLQLMKNAPTVDAEPWNVIHKTPMTEEERIEWSERIGYDIEYIGAFIYSNLPDDGEEVLVSTTYGRVYLDIFRDDDGCYFEDNGDMEGIIAWRRLPEPYKEKKDEID